MKRRIIALLFVLVMIFSVTACNKKTGGGDVPKGNVMHTTFKETTLDTDWVESSFVRGDEIVFLGTSSNEDYTEMYIDVITYNTLTDEMTKNQAKLDNTGNVSFNSVIAYEDGFVASMTQYSFYDEGGVNMDANMVMSESNDKSYVVFYDKSFNKVSEVDLTAAKEEIEKKGGYFYPYDFMIDGDYMYFPYDNALIKVDMEGKLAGMMEIEGWIERTAVVGNGKLAMYGWFGDNYRQQVKIIDMNTMAEESVVESAPANIRLMEPDGKGGLYLVTEQKLYQYNIETSENKEVLDWVECSILANGLSAFSVKDDGSFVVVSTEQEYDEKADKSYGIAEISTIKEVPASSVPVKKNLKVATLYLDSDVMQQIVKFNRASEEYRISVDSYVDDTFENYEEAIKQFNLDLASGTSADVYIANFDDNIRSLAAKGVFADLREMFKDDAYMNLDNMLPQAVDALTLNGKVFGVTTGFYVGTTAGSSDIVGKEGELTFEKLVAYMESHPDSKVFSNMSKSSILYTFLSGSSDIFFDFEKGECHFDTPDFINLLKLANTAPKEINEYKEDNADDLLSGRTLLANVWIRDFEEVQLYRKIFGDKASFVGFPGKEQSGATIGFDDIYCVSAKSKNKDGAAAYIKYVFENNDKQVELGRSWGTFPVRTETFEKMIADTLNANEDEGVHGIYMWGDMEIEIENITEEDVEILRKIISSISSVAMNSEDISVIVYEEASSFFEGKKSAEEVASIIQSKVQIMMDEQR